VSRIGGANPLPKQRLQAIFSPRIAMRVSRDWDYAVVAGVCPDDEKTGGRVEYVGLRNGSRDRFETVNAQTPGKAKHHPGPEYKASQLV